MSKAKESKNKGRSQRDAKDPLAKETAVESEETGQEKVEEVMAPTDEAPEEESDKGEESSAEGADSDLAEAVENLSDEEPDKGEPEPIRPGRAIYVDDRNMIDMGTEEGEWISICRMVIEHREGQQDKAVLQQHSESKLIRYVYGKEAEGISLPRPE